MSWFERSTFWKGLIGACLFSGSLACAQSIVSEENIVMEKIVYRDEMFRTTPEGLSKIRSNITPEVYTSGERYFPVMLVETADFKALDSAFIARIFNEEGFKENGVYGSVRDYFIESSNGQFKPTFDIYPIKLPNNFSNYNSDSKFILPSIDSLVERSDFKSRASMYGNVIPFIILHPTSKEEANKYDRYFFNHMDALKNSTGRIYSKNGYSFNSYAFVSQKAEKKPNATSTKDVAMLGAFIHEFCHVLGLSDLYSTNEDGYATIGPLPYDVMALGLRNGNGGYPPTFSAFEREAMGWLKPTEIVNGDSVYELKNLSKMQAYAVSNPNQPNEYYLVEYRPAVGFDSKIGSSSYSQKKGKNGVLIWYVDYNSRVFATNDPNGDINHQRVEMRSVLSQNQESFTGFNFINNNGNASVEGIFNVVFDGNDRVCFTVNRSKTLDKCPDIASSSSEAESSSSSVSSSSVEYSSSSSFGTIGLLGHRLVPGMQVHLSHGMLNVKIPMSGKKTLRFYDAIGNMVGMLSFVEQSASVDISGWNRPVFVRFDVNGRLIFAKRVATLMK
jgi:M6 family metalloprotease-like protein